MNLAKAKVTSFLKRNASTISILGLLVISFQKSTNQLEEVLQIGIALAILICNLYWIWKSRSKKREGNLMSEQPTTSSLNGINANKTVQRNLTCEDVYQNAQANLQRDPTEEELPDIFDAANSICDCGCGFRIGSLEFVRLYVESEEEQNQRETLEQYEAEREEKTLQHSFACNCTECN